MDQIIIILVVIELNIVSLESLIEMHELNMTAQIEINNHHLGAKIKIIQIAVHLKEAKSNIVLTKAITHNIMILKKIKVEVEGENHIRQLPLSITKIILVGKKIDITIAPIKVTIDEDESVFIITIVEIENNTEKESRYRPQFLLITMITSRRNLIHR